MSVIIFDIETGPLPDDQLLPMIPAFDPAEIKCGNLGREKAAEKVDAARAEHLVKHVSRAALSALTGQVLAIGYKRDDVVAIDGRTERQMLLRFWERCETELGRGGKLVGHNIHNFDLPFLVQRSWAIGLASKIAAGIREQGRYWSRTFVDTMTTWQLGNYRAEYVSLDRLAKFFGVGGKPEGVSGADFARLWETDRSQAEAYLRNDLEITYQVALRMGIA